MGMFDWVTFPYRMPDGHEGNRYQTKWLECELNEFKVTPEGQLLRTFVLEPGSQNKVGDTCFDGILWIGSAEAYRHCYNLHFRSGLLAAVECLQTNTTMVFDPQRILQLEPNSTTGSAPQERCT